MLLVICRKSLKSRNRNMQWVSKEQLRNKRQNPHKIKIKVKTKTKNKRSRRNKKKPSKISTLLAEKDNKEMPLQLVKTNLTSNCCTTTLCHPQVKSSTLTQLRKANKDTSVSSLATTLMQRFSNYLIPMAAARSQEMT